MKNCIVIAPWPGYTDMGATCFVNSVSDNVDRREAERLQVALSCFVIECPDEETAAAEVVRGREGLTPEAHSGFAQAAEATGERWFDWRNEAPHAPLDGPDAGPVASAEGPKATRKRASKPEATRQDDQGGPSAGAPGGLDPSQNDPSAFLTGNG